MRDKLLAFAIAGVMVALPAVAQENSRLDQVLDQIIANERELADKLADYEPLMETYLQTVKPDPVLGSVPVNDHYFFGRMRIVPTYTESPDKSEGEARHKKKSKKNKRKAIALLDDFHSQVFKPEAFARMAIVDRGAFTRENYGFDFVRSEFLGEVRTLVFDITPTEGKALSRIRGGRFIGRIWVEDQAYHIVRFNGVYNAMQTVSTHFDSWRMNMAPGLWLPAYVYTEESDRTLKQLLLTHKGQTRLWGYSVERPSAEDEFTKVMIDAPHTADPLDRPGMISPIESVRAWEAEAEDNVLSRLERVGLLSPPGSVDQILETVVANLEITNGLDIQPPIRCRILPTTPLESFTIGHTIVLSRGLLDVLPDEASLAMVLAHEMGHVLSGHKLDTRYAFTDSVLVGDRVAMNQFLFQRDPTEELDADNRAVELLENSPYKDDLGTAGLFLKQLAVSAGNLPSLIRPHFGSRIFQQDELHRLTQIMDAAPELEPASLEQTAALPLGGRVRLDPWNARVELMKATAVPLLSASEKLPFQVTPLMPYLVHFDSENPVAASGQAVDGGITDAIASKRNNP